MARRSAGLMMYRRRAGTLEVFLVHPGGPYFASKDEGVWTIPKGEFGGDEQALDAAQREFGEETGFASHEPFLDLGTVRQKGGKLVSGWAFEGDADAADLVSNTCLMAWPARSGKVLEIPEVDRGGWFTVAAAREKLKAEQEPLLARLVELLSRN